jgi:hypothetical protein
MDTWSYTQISRDGITWSDTTSVILNTYDADNKLVCVDFYSKDTTVTPSIWRIVGNAKYSIVSTNPKNVSQLYSYYNTSCKVWDTTMSYFIFDDNTITSIDYLINFCMNSTDYFKIVWKVFQWYDGTNIIGDSTLTSSKYFKAGLDTSSDTTLKRLSKNSYTYTDSTIENILYSWDNQLELWGESAKMVSTLNINKQPLVTTRITKSGDTWVNDFKDSILYTEIGNIAQEVHMLWRQDKWMLDNRTVHMTTNPPGFITGDVPKRSVKRMVKQFVTDARKTKKYDLCGREICNDSKTIPSYRITTYIDRREASGAVIFK